MNIEPPQTMNIAPHRLYILRGLLQLDRNNAENELAIAQLQQIRRQRVERRERTCWVTPWLLRRPQFGQYERLLHELREEDIPAFRNFLRMEPAMFQELARRVGPRIQKEDTNYR